MAILGIDEVGRGPLAGPLVVGAVILPSDDREWYAELKDSKKLSAKKREELNEIILAEATVGLGWVSNIELDEVGISEALRLATRRAVREVQRLHSPFSQIIIDGKVNFLRDTPIARYVSTVIKADDKIREVSAASIVAKVARDRYMKEIANKYLEYGFDQHMGYGTEMHRKAIARYGICPEHRRSFEPCKSLTGYDVKKIRAKEGAHELVNVVKNTTSVGRCGENAVVEYLVREGHEIVARNHKTYFYEIDIISVKDNKIFFTEVKYRRNDFAGGGLAAIDEKKQKQMRYAAESFLKFRQEYSTYDPLLAVADVTGKEFVVKDWFELA